ncbi:MAG: hypothetical protein LUG83_09975 [Lachnospiraceae bacterium]|nr:hypothetical protein [Lachnospiraceae bacterium]
MLSIKRVFSFSYKRILYVLCFLMFCIIDQRTKTCSGLDGLSETFRDSMGIVMAVVIMSHYRIEEFRRRKFLYLLWLVVSIAGGAAAFIWGMDNRPFLNDWFVIIADIILWGVILLHTVTDVFVEKKYPEVNKGFAAIWLCMLLWMIFSRSSYIWPLCYLIMFGCFYLTDFTEEEKHELLHGGLEGIILAFILFQGFCCIFRPYDMDRYVGIHNNSNLNALFYLYVLAASLIKIVHTVAEKRPLWLKLFYCAVLGAALSYLFMAIGRTGWLVAIILCLLFLVWMKRVQLKSHLIRNGLMLVLCAVIAFPVCFSATRYLPPVFHHPVWFWGEWSEDKVHSWDEWDSPKYTDLDELFDTAIGRITDSIWNILEHSPFMIKADAAEADSVELEEIEAEESEETAAASEEVPAVLTVEEGMDSLLVRKNIYSYYISNLNMTGHPYEEQGFQLTPIYWIGHAHNIYLQYGTDFGIPVMIMFAVLIVWSIAAGFIRMKRKKITQSMAAQLFVIIPAIFGLLEYAWGTASLSITMLFFAWGSMIISDKNN